MANYGISPNKMQSSYNDALLRAGIVTGLQATDEVPNGALVFADNTTALPTSTYGTLSINAENFKKYADGVTTAAYIVDGAEVNTVLGKDGNSYRVGSNLTSLSFPKDTILRMRKLQPEDRFYLFDGNVTGNVAVGNYLIPTADSFNFTAQAAAGDGLSILVQAILPLTAGLTSLGSQYLCKVVKI